MLMSTYIVCIYRARICRSSRSSGINSKESIPTAYAAWRVGTPTLFILGSQPPQIVLKFQHSLFRQLCTVYNEHIVLGGRGGGGIGHRTHVRPVCNQCSLPYSDSSLCCSYRMSPPPPGVAFTDQHLMGEQMGGRGIGVRTLIKTELYSMVSLLLISLRVWT